MDLSGLLLAENPTNEKKKVDPNTISDVTSSYILKDNSGAIIKCAEESQMPVKRKDTPYVGRKFEWRNVDMRSSAVIPLSTNRSGAVRRTSDYSIFTDFETWGADQPCSSAQAEARLKDYQKRESLFSRTYGSQCDTGYGSTSPGLFIQMPCLSTVEVTEKKDRNNVEKEPKQIELKKIEAKNLEPKEALPENGQLNFWISTPAVQKVVKPNRFVVKKVVLNVQNADGTASDNESTEVHTGAKEKSNKGIKVKVLRPENQPATAPDNFAGTQYGDMVDRLATLGTAGTLAEYNS
ncbi:hypothetical protein CRE_00848 [Caenorhabditis remanei]|uniref:Uncharacterized protein n=1 Tax=Caenorhabditis remanei TaxID=31234 RepID=E3LEP0_CAERE|nr:hypothetical protein CRE_00848 [Caenorhabditis remanei]